MKTLIIFFLILVLLFSPTFSQDQLPSHFRKTISTSQILDQSNANTTSTQSDTSDSSSTAWMYGTCLVSTLILITVLIYVCYNCSQLCKGGSRYGGKGSHRGSYGQEYPEQDINPPPYGKSLSYGQENPPAYGERPPVYDYRERGY